MSHATEPTTTGTTTGQPSYGFLEKQLGRSMDATALNLEQHNPDPEPNSIFEFMGVEIGRIEGQPEVKNRLTILLTQAIGLNGREGTQNLTISGDLDRAATDARRIAATGGTDTPPNVHRLRQLLNRPLSVLAGDGSDGEALAELDRLIATNPRAKALSASVIHNLGKVKARILIKRCGS